MDPQDQNPMDDQGQGGSVPADDGQAGGEEPQTPPAGDGEGEIAPPPPAPEEPGMGDQPAGGDSGDQAAA